LDFDIHVGPNDGFGPPLCPDFSIIAINCDDALVINGDYFTIEFGSKF
jgi:hypothetical protein